MLHFVVFHNVLSATLFCINTAEMGSLKKKREKEMIELSLLYNVIILQNTKGEVLLHCKRFYFKV